MAKWDERFFIIHREPKGKARPRVKRTGQAYTPKETVAYEALVRGEYLYQVGELPVLENPVDVLIEAMFEVPKSWSKRKKFDAISGEIRPGKPDCDNIAKMICDALNGLAYKDDAQIYSLRVLKSYTDQPSHINVWIVGGMVEE